MFPKPQEYPLLDEKDKQTSSSGNRVVISGVAGLFPSCHHVKDLNTKLYEKINPINENTRWKYNHPDVAKFMGNVPGISRFDAPFFKISYRLSNSMDPMARKILEQTYAAIYDAGLSPGQLSGRKIGVFIGTCFTEAESVNFYSGRVGLGIVGCSRAMFANLISYWLNIKGPSLSISDSCCSSIASLESAYRAILCGDCEAAIVGGANLCFLPHFSIQCGRIIKMSADSKTRSFDSNASGCVLSEGVCVIFLQKAKDALRIYADVVHVKTAFTSLVEGDMGPNYGFYRNPSNIVQFLKTFYEEAKVDPRAVQYVEAFGSATPEVDKLELDVIDEVFCGNRNNKLLVGSVMSNIGYGGAVSGMNSITKLLLGYHNGQIAANINCDSPREDVAALREGRIQIVTEHERIGYSYAAVNNMSLTGLNAHALFHGYYKPKDPSRYKSTIPYLVLISARQDSAVRSILDNLKTRPIDPEELALLHNIHETKISGHLGRGFTILDTTEENETVSLFEAVTYFDEAQRQLWFVYSGMGSQWVGMGADLMRIPIFAASIERCHKVLEPKGIDIVHIITSTNEGIFNNILHSFVGIAAIQIGLTDVLRELGIYPDKIIGHSVGELGCAYADGCFTAEEMILSAYSRGLVSVETPFLKGSMAAIGLGFQKISKLCPPEIEVACHNGPDSSTISGPAGIMNEFVALLTKQGIFAKEVPCSNIAFHSRYIAEAGPALFKHLSEIIKSPKPRSERWISTSVPQERWNEPLAKYSSAKYHTNNLLNPVLFEEASKLIPSNALVIEIAPHGLLQAILKRSLPAPCRHIPLTRRGHPDSACFLLEAIGHLYMENCLPKVKALYPKIEFPVSTGTPMLSHLIQWSYNEKWNIPVHISTNRKKAAARKYVISIHDDEHNYLSGHIIKGQIRYPFAAALVCVWDTLAMSLGVKLKKLSVQFREVHLFSQPILHDQRSLRLNVTLLRGTGRFEVMDDIILIARGYIFAEESQVTLDKSPLKAESKYLNSNEIYQLFYSKDYGYEGAFRSIYSTNFTQTNAKIIWQNNWVTLIDSILQLNAIRKIHNTVLQPNYIKNISINVKKHESTNTYKTDNLLLMRANIIDSQKYTSCGGILMENVQFLELPPTKENILLRSQDAYGIEHYAPLEEMSNSDGGIILKTRRVADVDSFSWVEAPETSGPGLTVKVHYAGVNNVSTNGKVGLNGLNNKKNRPCAEINFSGTTESGVSVMGVTQTEAIASSFKVQTDLLWPVPPSWSLEDAATVPLAYSMAFYILCIKTQLFPGYRVLVNEGAGALGQAIISIALAYGCEVFAAVSNVNEKQFLKRLFPELKDDYIVNSSIASFCDIVFTATNGRCCDIVITSSKGELKNSFLKCCALSGVNIDIGILHNSEDYQFGMHSLFIEKSFITVDFSSVFKLQYVEDKKKIQVLLSEGIARGYVRPLTRIVFEPKEVHRAFNLLANSGHHGSVLLHLNQPASHVLRGLIRTPQSFQVLVSDNNIFGIKLAEMLISRGAKKLILHLPNKSNLLLFKFKLWQEQGVTAKIFSSNSSHEPNIVDMLKSAELDGPIENILITVTKLLNANFIKSLKDFSTELKNSGLLPNILTVTKSGNDDEDLPFMSMAIDLGFKYISLPSICKINEKQGSKSISINSAIDTLERAIRVNQPVVVAYSATTAHNSLLHEIATITDIGLPNDTPLCVTLKQLNVNASKTTAINSYLRYIHNIYVPEDQILSLTLQKIIDLEKCILDKQFKETKGLKTFYSYIDPDELTAYTEMIFLPTLTNDSCMEDGEFDENETYLYIVSGLEGLHLRFQELCEQLKVSVIVLQRGLDKPNESIRDVAYQFTMSLLSKRKFKNKFYLLGYECGIFVALEMAAILEEYGLTGTVFCLGGSPDLIKRDLDDNLSGLETDTALQDGVVKHMYSLMVDDDIEKLDAILRNATTWDDRVKACVQLISGRLPCSNQYIKELIQMAYLRILQARQYHPQPHKLRSLLVSLTPRHSFDTKSLSLSLSQFSQQPVIYYQLKTPLASVAQDLQCASIVNRHLDTDLLDSYNERNHCETYFLNSGSNLTSDVV